MSVELRLLDHFKFSSRLSANFACEYSEDDRISIISDTGVYILALRGYLTNPFPSFSCKNDFLRVSDFTPSSHVDINVNSFHKDLERNDLYEATMCVEYSTDLSNTTPIEPSPLTAQWSPRGIVGKTDCLLAVLTNLHSLEIYVKYLDENEALQYCTVCNVTLQAINETKPQWKNTNVIPVAAKLNELKRRIQRVACTAFTWGHVYKIDNKAYCAIFVGHMNGDITVWRLKERPSNSKEHSQLKFLGRCSTQLKRIVRMHWHYTTDHGGGLSFADSDGKMSVLHVQNLHKDVVLTDSEYSFWSEPDNVAVDKISVMTHDGYTFIILVKQSFLILYGMDESGGVFDQKIYNAKCYYITGLHHFDNVILVLTLPGVLKQLTLTVIQKRIRLEEKIVHTKMTGTKYRTHGLFFSKNLVLFGMVTYPCTLRSFSKLKSFLNVFIFHNTTVNPLDVVWYNTSGTLRDFWDCFEALRLLCLKEKRFPWLGILSDLNYDSLSLVRLKTLRWLSKLSEMVFGVVPVVKSYDIKPYVILHYLVQIKLIVARLSKLLSDRESGRELSEFQMQSVDLQNFFLKEMVAKNILAKANVGKNFIEEMKGVMSVANELRYPRMPQCVWCGERISGPVCLPPHADSRCSVSMMPIFLVPAYKCPFCKVVAHKEVEKEEDVIFCLFCDVPMEKLYVDENEGFSNEDFEFKNGEVKSVCFDDCLKDEIDFSDVEENETEYVIFSDSDDESEDEQGKLSTLYVKMKHLTLEEILKIGCDRIYETEEAGPSKKQIKNS